MKTTLIALAAASIISLGTAGTASAAPNAGLDITNGSGASVEKVGGRRRLRFRYYGYGYRYYGHGYHHRCKRLYYKGWVLGFAWARYKYFKYCSNRSYY